MKLPRVLSRSEAELLSDVKHILNGFIEDNPKYLSIICGPRELQERMEFIKREKRKISSYWTRSLKKDPSFARHLRRILNERISTLYKILRTKDWSELYDY